jgi:methyl-accepting chemotaxis protein
VTDLENRPVLPPGLLSGLLFFGVVIVGSGYIIFSKLHDFGAFAVTAVPVLIMIGYAVMLGARLFRLRDDQSGDNLYYMGFLFTLTSLAVSLYQFSAAGSAEQIVQNFGIAIASTIAGITLRILFNQMRRDPVEVEATARMELAEASRRVKRELESAILEFGYFRRMTQQSITDVLDEVRESIGVAHEKLAGELQKLAVTASKPFEEASSRSGETLDGLNERTVEVLNVSKQLVLEGEQFATSTTRIVKAVDALFTRLESYQIPEKTLEAQLAPLLESVTLAVKSLNDSAEIQAKNVEINLEHAQSVVVAVNQLLQEIHAAEAPRLPAPRPQRVATDEP